MSIQPGDTYSPCASISRTPRPSMRPILAKRPSLIATSARTHGFPSPSRRRLLRITTSYIGAGWAGTPAAGCSISPTAKIPAAIWNFTSSARYFFDERSHLRPGHGPLMHRENRGHGNVLALHRLDHFAHQFGGIQGPIGVQRQGVAGIEQLMFGKIDHVLPLGGSTAQRIKDHAIAPASSLFFFCPPPPYRPARRPGQQIGLLMAGRCNQSFQERFVQVEN